MQNDFNIHETCLYSKFEALEILKNKRVYNSNFDNKEINAIIYFINIKIINQNYLGYLLQTNVFSK